MKSQLLIPKDDAISIIRVRLSEIDANNFNYKVWKDRTTLDMSQIFGLGSSQWLQISQLRFDTPLSSQAEIVYHEGKKAAKGLLTSYIDFIETYSKIELARRQKVEANVYENYKKLLADYNEQSKEYIKLMDEHSQLIDKYSNLLDENESIGKELDDSYEEIESLKNNTVQLDNVTLQKLWTAIKSLPTGQIVAIIAAISAIIYFAFATGQLIEKNSANNDSFELKKENSNLESSVKIKQDKIDSLDKIIFKQNDTIQKFKNINSHSKLPK